MLAAFQVVLIILSAVAMVNIMIVLDRTSHSWIDHHHSVVHEAYHVTHNTTNHATPKKVQHRTQPARDDPDLRQHEKVSDITKPPNDLSIFEEPSSLLDILPIVEPDILCAESHTVIIYVLTTPGDRKSRDLIRATWGNHESWAQAEEHQFNVQFMFVMGRTNEPTQHALREEIEKDKDILQGDFNDTYDVLVYKGLFALKWIKRTCTLDKIDFVFKTDDDVFVNIFQLLHHMKLSFARYTPCHFLCNVFQNVSVPRDGKWSLSRAAYSADTLPTYCQGVGYAVCKQGLSLLLKKIERIREPPLRLEDVYLTSWLPRGGIISAHAPEIVYHRISHSYILQKPQALDKHNLRHTVMIHQLPKSAWVPLHSFLARSLKKYPRTEMKKHINELIPMVKNMARSQKN